MADNFDLDFGDLDDLSLDTDTVTSSDGSTKTRTKRGLVKEFSAGVLSSLGISVKDPSINKKLLKALLPSSYTPVFTATDQLVKLSSDLYDKVNENTRDGVKEIKGVLGEALAVHGGKLPEKMLARLDDWAKSGQTDYTYSGYGNDSELDVDEDNQEFIDTITQSSTLQAAISQAQHKEQMALDSVISQRQTKLIGDTNRLLTAVVQQNARVIGFNEQVAADYQRKALELQVRQYRLSLSSARMQEGFYKNTLRALETINTNISLPDFVKLQQHQKSSDISLLNGMLKSKSVSKYGNYLYDALYSMADEKSTMAGNKLNASSMLARVALSGANAARSGGGLSANNMGMMFGSALTSIAPWLVNRYASPYLEKNARVKGAGSNLSYYAESMPGLINQFLKNSKGLSQDYDPLADDNKWYTKMQKTLVNPFINNLLSKVPTTHGNRTKLQSMGVKDLNAPAQWDGLQRRTILEVIPGLLTKQLTMLTKIYTGSDDVEDVEFNHKRGVFTSSKEVVRDIKSSVFNRQEFQSTAGGWNTMVDAVDPEKRLSPNARVALAMRFARDGDAGDGFEINNYLKSAGWGNTKPKIVKEIQALLRDSFEVREATGLARKFGKYQIGNSTQAAGLRQNIATSMRTYSGMAPNVEEELNLMANTGNRARMKEMGLIRRVNGVDEFNHDMYWEMMEQYIKNPNYRIDLEGGPSGGSGSPNQGPGKRKRKPRKRNRRKSSGLPTQADETINDIIDDSIIDPVGAKERLKDAIVDIVDNTKTKSKTTFDNVMADARTQSVIAQGNEAISKVNTFASPYMDSAKESIEDTVSNVKAELAAKGVSKEVIDSKVDEIRAEVIRAKDSLTNTNPRTLSDKVRSKLKLPTLKTKGFNVKSFLADKTGNLFGRKDPFVGPPTKEELELNRTDALLTQIYRQLARNNDPDGTGDNSWKSIMKRRKAKKEESEHSVKLDENGVPKEKPKSMFGLLGSLVGMVGTAFGAIKKHGIIGSLASFLGMGWLGDLISGIGSIVAGKRFMDGAGDLLDMGDGRRNRRGRRGGKKGLLRRAAGWGAKKTGQAALWGGKKAVKGAGRLGTGIVRRGTGFAKAPGKSALRMVKGAGIIGVGMAGFDAYSSYQEGDYKGVAEAAGGGLGGALGGAAVGAAIGSVVPVVGTFIGGLIGGAVGYFAGSSAAGALYDLAKSPGPLTKMRLYQYGLNTTDQRRIETILKTEDALTSFVSMSKDGHAALSPGIPIEDIANLYITDPEDEEMIQEWITWFTQRFKPVYLTHMALNKEMFKGKPLQEIDKNDDKAAKYEYARRAQMFDPGNGHPYRFTGRIFEDTQAINQAETTGLVEKVVAELKKDLGKMGTETKTTSGFMSGNDKTFSRAEANEDVVKAIGKVDGVNTTGVVEKGWFGSERTVVSVKDMLKDILPPDGKPLDDLTAVRMKMYGIANLDIMRVQALLQFELVMQNRIRYNNNGATYDGDMEEVFNLTAPIFLSPTSNWVFKNWKAWFQGRFLPIFLTYAGKMKELNGTTNPIVDAKYTSADIADKIVTAMKAATGESDGTSASVWSVVLGPWPGYKLNDDPSVLDQHIRNIRSRIKETEYRSMPTVERKSWSKEEDGTITNSTVKDINNIAYESMRMQTRYNPTTGRTEQGFRPTPASGLNPGGMPSGHTAGGLPNTNTSAYDEPAVPVTLKPGAEEWVNRLITYAVQYGITSKDELAMILGNCHNETGGFTEFKESKGYTWKNLMNIWPKRFPTKESAVALVNQGKAAVLNNIYGGRMGNTEPGDGWKYRGRGPIQLTGKDNYRAVGKLIGVDLVKNPDLLVTDADVSAKSVIGYWKVYKELRKNAMAGNWERVRYLANGGTTGMKEATKWYHNYTASLQKGDFDAIISKASGNPTSFDQDANMKEADKSGVKVPTDIASTEAPQGGPGLGETLAKGANQTLTGVNSQGQMPTDDKIPMGTPGTPDLKSTGPKPPTNVTSAASNTPTAINSKASVNPEDTKVPDQSGKPNVGSDTTVAQATPHAAPGQNAGKPNVAVGPTNPMMNQPLPNLPHATPDTSSTVTTKPVQVQQPNQAKAAPSVSDTKYQTDVLTKLDAIASAVGRLAGVMEQSFSKRGVSTPPPVAGANGNNVSMAKGSSN